MITKCPYCDYSYPNQVIPMPMLLDASRPDLPQEDFMLYMERIIRYNGLNHYAGVKVHIGRKHKGEYNVPLQEFTPREIAIINGEYYVQETKANNDNRQPAP